MRFSRTTALVASVIAGMALVPLTGLSAQAAPRSPDCSNHVDMYEVARLPDTDFDVQYWDCRGVDTFWVKAKVPQATDSKCWEVDIDSTKHRGTGYYHWKYSPSNNAGTTGSGKLIRCNGTTDELVHVFGPAGGGGGGTW